MNRYIEAVEEARQKRIYIDKKMRKEIRNLYDSAYASVIKQLENIEDKDELSILILQTKARELKKANLKLVPKIKKIVKRDIKKVSNMQVDTNMVLLNEIKYYNTSAKIQTIKENFATISKNVVEALETGQLYKDGKTLSTRIWQMQDNINKNIDYIIRISIAEGKSIQDTAKDLVQYVRPDITKNYDFKKHYPRLLVGVDYNAYRLARTSIGHAYQLSTIYSAKNNPFCTGVKWHSALTHDTCPICRQRHGKIYNTDEVPLDHPNGACTTYLAFDKDLREIGSELGEWVNGKENPLLDKWYDNLSKNGLKSVNFGSKNDEKEIKKKDINYKIETPKTLQNFEKYSKKWENNVVKKYLSDDDIELIGKEIKKLIDDNEFSMRVNHYDLEKILKDGKFKNQFETGTSGGALNSDIRKKATKQLFGKSRIKELSEYEKYGYLGHFDFVKDMRKSGTSQYGNCIIHFSKDKLKNNVTYTIDDSLGLAYNKLTIAGDVNNPKANGINEKWLDKMKNYLTSNDKSDNLTEFCEHTGAKYIELQYHGEIKTDYIDKICFVKDLPDETVLNILKDNGVKLFKIVGDWDDEKAIRI